jgi:autotransporter-associated beta strand protein
LPGERGIVGDTVLFQSAAGGTANLDGATPTLAGVTFNSSMTSYTIAPGTGGSLQMNNGASSAAIDVAAGSHSITAGLALLSNLSVDAAAGSTLTIGGAISGAGKSLTLTGAGTVILSGPNSFTGGTNVSGGSLIVEYGASLGGSLTIGSGALVTIAASDANGNPLVEAASAAAPESSAANASSAAPAVVEAASTAAAQPVSMATMASLDAESTPSVDQLPFVGGPSPIDAVEAPSSTTAATSIGAAEPARVGGFGPFAIPDSILPRRLLTTAAADRHSGRNTSHLVKQLAIVDDLLEQRARWSSFDG